MGCVIAIAGSAVAQDSQADAIRVWGHGHRGQNYIETLLRDWETGFAKTHPGVRFENDLYGDASAIGALFTGTGELAILDREASFIEVDAYQQGAGYDPFGIAVARGAVDFAHHAPALKVYVNKANPLGKLTVEQLDGIFDADHRLGTKSYKTWGDLGLTGEWADKPIQMYAPEIQSAEMQFFERAALKKSQKFSCCLRLFGAGAGKRDANAEVASAVARDRFGIGISAEASAAVKEVALSLREGDAAVTANPDSITSGKYPLARTVYVYVNRKPKAEISPVLKAFLEYVVSAQGQAVVKSAGYLPLSEADAAKAKEALQ